MNALLTRLSLSPPAGGGSAAAGGEGGQSTSPLRPLRGYLPRLRGRKRSVESVP